MAVMPRDTEDVRYWEYGRTISTGNSQEELQLKLKFSYPLDNIQNHLRIERS